MTEPKNFKKIEYVDYFGDKCVSKQSLKENAVLWAKKYKEEQTFLNFEYRNIVNKNQQFEYHKKWHILQGKIDATLEQAGLTMEDIK